MRKIKLWKIPHLAKNITLGIDSCNGRCEIIEINHSYHIEFIGKHPDFNESSCLLFFIEVTNTDLFVIYKHEKFKETALLIAEDIKARVIDPNDFVIEDFSDT